MLFNGDGSLLMNLGCLVTIIAAGVKNLTLIVVDNGVYEVTGGQQTAGAQAGVDFCGMARSAGFASIAHFDDLADWQRGAAAALKSPARDSSCWPRKQSTTIFMSLSPVQSASGSNDLSRL